MSSRVKPLTSFIQQQQQQQQQQHEEQQQDDWKQLQVKVEASRSVTQCTLQARVREGFRSKGHKVTGPA